MLGKEKRKTACRFPSLRFDTFRTRAAQLASTSEVPSRAPSSNKSGVIKTPSACSPFGTPFSASWEISHQKTMKKHQTTFSAYRFVAFSV